MAITGTTELGNGLLVLTVDADPRVTPVDAPAGSTIIYVGSTTSSIIQGDHFRKEDSGSSTNMSEAGLKNSFAETTNPGVSDDNTQDYQIGSRWINVTLDKEFVCLDASTGAAVWKLTSRVIDGQGVFLAKPADIRTNLGQHIRFLPIESGEFPAGVTLNEIHLKLSVAGVYSVTIGTYSDELDTTPSDTTVVATAGGESAKSSIGLSIAVATGTILGVDIPTTAIDWSSIRLVYTIK